MSYLPVCPFCEHQFDDEQVMAIVKQDLPTVATVRISLPKEILNAGCQAINGTSG